MRIFFWQNVISPHQAPYIRALAINHDLEVHWIAQHDLPKWRTDMGWSSPTVDGVNYWVNPTYDDIKGIFDVPQHESIHIFSPNWTLPTINKAFRMAVNSDTTIGLLSESSDLSGLKGMLRLAAGVKRRIQYGDRVDFVLAIGSVARNYYKSCGWDTGKIHDFAYVTEPVGRARCFVEKGEHAPILNCDQKKFKIVFVGQLVFRKGVDLALLALSELSPESFYLNIIGDGPEKDRLILLTKDLGISDVVSFCGSVPNSDANAIISESDILVLPSRRDGWGAVVNEALMVGVPVICSDACGAADLLGDSYRGKVFKSGSVKHLRDLLKLQLDYGKLSSTRRNKIKTWAQNNITGSVVALYLLDIINYVNNGGLRPKAPWTKTYSNLAS